MGMDQVIFGAEPTQRNDHASDEAQPEERASLGCSDATMDDHSIDDIIDQIGSAQYGEASQ